MNCKNEDRREKCDYLREEGSCNGCLVHEMGLSENEKEGDRVDCPACGREMTHEPVTVLADPHCVLHPESWWCEHCGGIPEEKNPKQDGGVN